MKVIKNIAASVHSRLLDRARGAGRPFQEFLEHFGMERFLYRLSRSAYVERFVLKGALMLRVWDAPSARPTRVRGDGRRPPTRRGLAARRPVASGTR